MRDPRWRTGAVIGLMFWDAPTAARGTDFSEPMAQAATVSGIVFDSISHALLANADVQLLHEGSPPRSPASAQPRR